jgi:hypothetical protein
MCVPPVSFGLFYNLSLDRKKINRCDNKRKAPVPQIAVHRGFVQLVALVA